MNTYRTKGVCAKEVSFTIDDNKVKDVEFLGGCNGNLKGIGSLIEGMDIHTAIERLKGIGCGVRATSCPDQLSKALEEYLEQI